MNSRERMTRAIEFGTPDRVPMVHVVLPGAATQFGQVLDDLLTEFPDDVGGWWRGLAYSHDPAYRPGRYEDEWGCVYECVRPGLLGRVVGHPLADWDAWPAYRFPAPPEPGRFAAVGDEVERAGHAHYVFASGGLFGDCSLFERMILLRGFGNLMLDLVAGEPRLYELRDRLVEYSLDSVRQDALTPADGVGFADDWGTETALMISPKLWRTFYRPAYAAVFAPVLAAGKHIHFHTDGYTYDILADLVDLGVSVLNVQHSVMDVRRLGRELGGRVAFRSDVDCQQVLQHGTRQQVYDHVKEIVECLGSSRGGLIGHGEVEPDMPLENVRWMLEAFDLFGRYD